MTTLDSLVANLPGYLARASLGEILVMLDALQVELEARALPGSLLIMEASHALRLSTDAARRAPAPIFSGDCGPPACECGAGPGSRALGVHEVDCPAGK